MFSTDKHPAFIASVTPIAEKHGEETKLDGIGGDGLTALAFPKLASLRIEEDFTGYKAHIDSGLGIGDGIDLSEVTVKKVSLDPLEGGSVKVGFTLICHPDAATIGALCDLLQDEVELTLSPPQADAQKKAA